MKLLIVIFDPESEDEVVSKLVENIHWVGRPTQ
jgi:hypothetical protein